MLAWKAKFRQKQSFMLSLFASVSHSCVTCLLQKRFDIVSFTSKCHPCSTYRSLVRLSFIRCWFRISVLDDGQHRICFTVFLTTFSSFVIALFFVCRGTDKAKICISAWILSKFSISFLYGPPLCISFIFSTVSTAKCNADGAAAILSPIVFFSANHECTCTYAYVFKRGGTGRPKGRPPRRSVSSESEATSRYCISWTAALLLPSRSPSHVTFIAYLTHMCAARLLARSPRTP